ncbi:MAG: DUF4129 domain-containing protein [Lachnospiraceae bacterium]|nr:DUF4129 domain-containing protein [Lachnospiraceae bacterium]
MILYYLKDVCLILFYIAIMRANNEVFETTVNFIPMIILMALGPVVSKYLFEHYDERTRFLGLIPVIGAILVSPLTVNNILLAIPPVIYTAVLVYIKFKDIEYYSFVKLFRILLIGGAAALVIHFALVMEILSVGGTYDKSNIVAGLGYFAAFTAIGIFVARKLRFNADGLKAVSFAGFLGIVGAAAVISIIMVYTKEYVYKAVRYILMIVIMPFGYLLGWWSRLMEDAGAMVAIASADAEKASTVDPPAIKIIGYDKPMPEYDLPLNVIILAGTVIIVAVLLFLSIRILNSKAIHNSRDEFEKDKVGTLKKAKKVQRFSNKEKVRKIYRHFIEIMTARGIKITESMTSQEILDLLMGKMGYSHAAALRDVYILARYDDYGSVTDEEVRLAKEALKKLSM